MADRRSVFAHHLLTSLLTTSTVIALFACLGAGKSDSDLRARSIELVDKEGRVRVLIGQDAGTKRYGVCLKDAEGETRAEISLDELDNPFLLFRRADGSWSSHLITDSWGDGRLEFLASVPKSESSQTGEKSVVRAAIGVAPLPAPSPVSSMRPGYVQVFNLAGSPKKSE